VNAQQTRKVDRRRRYSDEQQQRALALIEEGKTVKQAAFVVGATRNAVRTWLKRAGQTPAAGRRHFTAAEINEAVTLVQGGASLREAAAAVGTTGPTVLRWLRRAGQTPATRRRAAFTPDIVREAVALVQGGATMQGRPRRSVPRARPCTNGCGRPHDARGRAGCAFHARTARRAG
jgi:transposase-like protein